MKDSYHVSKLYHDIEESLLQPAQAAWSGKTIQYINNHINESLEQRPNVVLLHAGTNDMDTRSSISREGSDPKDAALRLGQLIDKIMEYCPDAVILVAIPLSSCDGYKPKMPGFRALVPGIVRQRRQNGEHVIAVDFSTFDLNDLRDCLHPTNDGYSIMGDYWYDFLTQVPDGWIKTPVGDDPEREEEENGVGGRIETGSKTFLGICLCWILYWHVIELLR
jgi:hypothetical protein